MKIALLEGQDVAVPQQRGASRTGRTQVVMIVKKKQNLWAVPSWTGIDELTGHSVGIQMECSLPQDENAQHPQPVPLDRDGGGVTTFLLPASSEVERFSPPAQPENPGLGDEMDVQVLAAGKDSEATTFQEPLRTATSPGSSRPQSRLQDTRPEEVARAIPDVPAAEIRCLQTEDDETRPAEQTQVPELLPAQSFQSMTLTPNGICDALSQSEESEARAMEDKVKSSYPKRTLDWRKNREAIMLKQKKVRICIAVLGISGAMCAVAQNELVMRSWNPRLLIIDVFKAANLTFSMLSVAFLFRSYFLFNLYQNLKEFLYSVKSQPKPFRPWNPIRFWALWFEVLLCGFHIPPFVTFEVASWTQENFTLYRAETIGSLANVLRVYLLWPCIRDQVLSQFPKLHTVAAFYDMDMGSGFALKTLVNGSYAVQFIAAVWFVTMCVSGYWYRGVENTACFFWNETIHAGCFESEAKVWTQSLGLTRSFEVINDLYVQNAAWAMFVTSTTVGFGDIVPSTHLGRGIAAAMALVGISMIALLTASLANALKFTPAELSAILIMEREKARQIMHKQAADRIITWWRIRKGQYLRFWHDPSGWTWRIKFRQNKRKSQIDVEDCMADNVKVDKISESFKYVASAMELITHKVQSRAMGSVATLGRASSTAKPASSLPELLQNVKARKASITLRHRIQEARERGESTAELVPQASIISLDPQQSMIHPRDAWKHDKEELQRFIVKAGFFSAVFGLIGTAAAIVQNELVIRGTHPNSLEINVLKAAVSVVTVLCMGCIVRLYWLTILFERVMNHILRGTKLDTRVKVSAVLKQISFWVELAVVAPHVPPLVTFEIGTTTLMNFSLYRAETVMCTWNLGRIYLLWRVMREWAVSDLPKRHTVAAFANVNLGSIFAIKRLLNSWYALNYLACGWFVLVMLLGYLFRSGELTACQADSAEHWKCQTSSADMWSINGEQFEKRNDLYIQNAVWLVFISTMTVGYGEIVPTTHYGRVAVSLAALLGIVMASLVTASCANMIEWHPSETAARAMLMREQARQQLAARAVNLLSFWWRKRHGRKMSKRQQSMEFYQLRREFLEVRDTAVVDVEDCTSSSAKLEQGKVDSIADRLWADDNSRAYAEHMRRANKQGPTRASSSVEQTRRTLLEMDAD